MSKVYCKNCKYRDAFYGKDWKWCDSPHLKHNVENEFTGKLTDKDIARKSDLNTDGNCPHYKKSCYKFWIK